MEATSPTPGPRKELLTQRKMRVVRGDLRQKASEAWEMKLLPGLRTDGGGVGRAGLHVGWDWPASQSTESLSVLEVQPEGTSKAGHGSSKDTFGCYMQTLCRCLTFCFLGALYHEGVSMDTTLLPIGFRKGGKSKKKKKA